jgi:hypothetical protein
LIYIVEAIGTGLMKIGRTNGLDRRIQAMQTDCPVEIKILFQTKEMSEKDIHRLFANFHSHKEWFRINDESRGMIDALADAR